MKKGTSEPLPPTYRIRRVTIDTWLCSIGQKQDCFARKEGNSSNKCRVSRPAKPDSEPDLRCFRDGLLNYRQSPRAINAPQL